MFEITFLITLSLFIGTTLFSVLSLQSEKESYMKTAKLLFLMAITCFITLGIFKFFSSYKGNFINIASSIWGYFYLLSLLIIIIILSLYLTRWKNQLNTFVTLISPFIVIIMLISVPFINSTRKMPLNSDLSILSAHILPAHIIITIIGEIFFFFSFIGSILYLIMEWQLRKKTSIKLILKLPSLESINNFNKWSISKSFILISLGILIGMIMAFINYKTLSLGTAKEIHIYFSWIIIAGIFYVRRNMKITSHKINIINIILFALIMFLFVFTNIFITKGFHSFI